ncbi:hypothetical protein [Poritiphilus flavus]|uniref:Uncharacterized protein n=1 Tax=Poritiphilus flavus TaxID=2697053 RepID=A0A6L9EB77_9FLAO|nr:hypothetical protein [Poritiphilus flavus]NAS11893.1 hypothetical protein [Poritiphilus flavus]
MEKQDTKAKKIKLIWDFRGPTARNTAQHYKKHLLEYAVLEGLDLQISGSTDLSDAHSIAYLVVNESQMRQVRDDLKPNRGEIYDG